MADGASGPAVVVFDIFDFTDFGRPHVFDSVELTKLSFGLLGSHIAALCSGVNDDAVVVVFDWAWAPPKTPNPLKVTVVEASTIDINTRLKDTFAIFLNRKWTDIKKQLICRAKALKF